MSVHITERMATIDRFKDVLRAAMSERGKRPDQITLDDGRRELGWVLFEQQQMFAAVNQARAERGLPAIWMDSVRRVEQMACGHVDYFEKFAFYCAELALGENEPRP